MTGREAGDGVHLRLVWPQWQGAGSSSVRALASEFPFDVARRGYAVGTAVLEAILPPHVGPTAVVPVATGDDGLELRDGIEAKTVVLEQLRSALTLLDRHDPSRITTIGGDCSVSMAPFAWLSAKYGADLAILWIDTHPDIDTGQTAYEGYHAMVVSGLTGRGDPNLLAALPSTIATDRVALVGTHDWSDPALAAAAEQWRLAVIPPDALRHDSTALLDWVHATGASKLAIHFDVDTVDADEVRFGLGADRGGLTMEQVRRVVADASGAGEVVGLTIAEYIPRQVMHLQAVLADFPLMY
ncbi:arginase family protein [Microbacterium kunmingense]|uniref:arginase family protein n=1 Tax=Microbacterium kunmingense TaxID=2915939 RepID=UPI0020035C94|nr:arginase family protein [Microbacterium kunmingense]